MKKRIAGMVCMMLTLIVASSLVFADTQKQGVQKNSGLSGEVSFTAELQFDAATDEHVKLLLTNYGEQNMHIAKEAQYMDELGTAGSWDCHTKSDASVKPGQTATVEFYISRAVAHGDNSILAFFFQYDGRWYLGKAGTNNGVEFFQQHN